VIAANDYPLHEAMQRALNDPCQLRSLIAHAAALLAQQTTPWQARQALLDTSVKLDDRPGMIDVAREVAARCDVSVDDLRGPDRSRWATAPRQEAMYLIRKTGRFSLKQIGDFFGGRDHTTVLHACRAHERRAGL
jgi:chromosomal replication initiator protein